MRKYIKVFLLSCFMLLMFSSSVFATNTVTMSTFPNVPLVMPAGIYDNRIVFGSGNSIKILAWDNSSAKIGFDYSTFLIKSDISVNWKWYSSSSSFSDWLDYSGTGATFDVPFSYSSIINTGLPHGSNVSYRGNTYISGVISSTVAIYDASLTSFVYTPPTNQELVNSNNYKGLLITSPANNSNVANHNVSFVANLRIPSTLNITSSWGGMTTSLGSIVSSIQKNLVVNLNGLSVNPTNVLVSVGNLENGYYNVTISGFVLAEIGSNSFTLSTKVISGSHMGLPTTDNYDYTSYSNTITFTSAVNPSDPNSFNKDGSIPNPGDLPNKANYTNDIPGNLQFTIDTVLYYIKWPFVALGNLFISLFGLLGTFMGYVTSTNSFITSLFSAFPVWVSVPIGTVFTVVCVVSLISFIRGK